MVIPKLIIKDGEGSLIFKTLSSDTRWNILKLLRDHKKLNITEIAGLLEQTEANISVQIKILEKAGLIITIYEVGNVRAKKYCSLAYERLVIEL